MPLLKDLNCWIELAGSLKKLQEFGTFYGDGFVETFVTVPSVPQPFAIRLTSASFIAPGLAMYVFIDGVYQCNRNRQGLKLREPLDRRSLVNFCVRQKEEKQSDGSLIARDWTFERLDTTSANDAPDLCSANTLDNIGCIEVIVLRCTGSRTTKSASANSSKAHTINLDGASDAPDHYVGLDGQPRDWNEQFDEREVNFRSRRSHLQPSRTNYGPPPPLPHGYSYAKNLYSHEDARPTTQVGSRTARDSSPPFSGRYFRQSYSGHTKHGSSGWTELNRIPSPGYQYGTGPVPHQTKAESQRELFQERTSKLIPPDERIVDPQWLDELLTTAVKRGLEESNRKKIPSQIPIIRRQDRGTSETNHQHLGAWPNSPFGPTIYQSADQHQETQGTKFGALHESDINATSYNVANHADVSGWGPQEAGSDARDMNEIWETKKDRKAEIRGDSERPLSKASIWSDEDSPRVVLAASQKTKSERRRSDNNHGGRSRHANSAWEASVETSAGHEGWTVIDAPSDSTNLPSHSRSQISRRKGSPDKRRRNQHQFQNGYGIASPSEFIPSVRHPGPLFDSHNTRPRHSSTYKAPTATTIPPPIWGCAVLHKTRKYRKAATSEPPPPYAPISKDFAYDTTDHRNASGSSSSSSWAFEKKDETSTTQKMSTSRRDVSSSKDNNKTSEAWRNVGFSDRNRKYSKKDEASNYCRVSNTDGHIDNASRTNDQETSNRDNGFDWDNKGDTWNNIASKTQEHQRKHFWGADNNNWGTNEALKHPNDKSKDTWGSSGFGKDKNRSEYQEGKAESATGDGDFDNIWSSNNNWSKQENFGDWSLNQDNNAGWDTTNNVGGWDTGDKDNTNKLDNQWAIIGDEDTESAPPAKDNNIMSQKSCLTKYRQYPQPPDMLPKSHWRFPPSPSLAKKLHAIPQDYDSVTSAGDKKIYTIPEEPLHKFSKEKAEEKGKEGIEHQVRAGKGSMYGHAVGRPEYLDSLDKPYAVFRFKYRTRSALKSMFGDEVPDHESSNSCKGPSTTDGPEAIKEKLKQLHQDQLIENLMKLQAKLANKDTKSDNSNRSHGTESVAQKMTERWVQQHSRQPSEHAASKPASVKPVSERGFDAANMQWGQDSFKAATVKGSLKSVTKAASDTKGWGGWGGEEQNDGDAEWGGGFTGVDNEWK